MSVIALELYDIICILKVRKADDALHLTVEGQPAKWHALKLSNQQQTLFVPRLLLAYEHPYCADYPEEKAVDDRAEYVESKCYHSDEEAIILLWDEETDTVVDEDYSLDSEQGS